MSSKPPKSEFFCDFLFLVCAGLLSCSSVSATENSNPNRLASKSSSKVCSQQTRAPVEPQPKPEVRARALPLISKIQNDHNRGRLNAAEEISKGLISYLRINDNAISLPLAMTQHSELLYDQRRYDEALGIQEEAISIVKRNGFSEHPFIGLVINHMSTLFIQRGDTLAAVNLYREFIIDNYTRLICRVEASGGAEEQLALTRFRAGLREKSNQIRKWPRPEWAVANPEAWELLLMIYQYTTSLTDAFIGVKSIPPSTIAQLHQGAGSLLLALKDPSAALSRYKTALKILLDSKSVSDQSLQSIVPGMRDSYFGLSRFKDAIQVGKNFSEYTKKHFGPNSKAHVESIYSVAKAYEAAGEIGQAKIMFKSLIETNNQLASEEFTAKVNERYASLLVRQGMRSKTLRYLHNALKSRLVELDRLSTRESGIGTRAGLANKLRSTHLDISAAIASYTKDSLLVKHAANAALLIKNLEIQGDIRDGVSERYEIHLFDLRGARISMISKWLSALKDENGREAVYVDVVKNQSISRHSAESGGLRYTALVIKADGTVSVFDLGSAVEIDKAIASLLRIQAENLNEANDVNYKSSITLLTQVFSTLGRNSRIFLNPDGEFSKLPVAYVNHVINSSSVKAADLDIELVIGVNPNYGTGISKQQRSLVIANPGYGDASRGNSATRATLTRNSSHSLIQINFSRLPYAQKEGEYIAKLIDGVLVHGWQANVNTFLSIKNPKILHVAVHGFFLPNTMDMPALPGPIEGITFGRAAAASSGLVLAPRGDSNSYYELVLAGDIAGMDLRETELVVLSACDTGLGVLGQGSATTALAAAIFNAGAKNVILTLWPVDDRATSVFMEHFYKKYLDGESASIALSETQRLFASGNIVDPLNKEEWRRPYYWGAFQLFRRQ